MFGLLLGSTYIFTSNSRQIGKKKNRRRSVDCFYVMHVSCSQTDQMLEII